MIDSTEGGKSIAGVIEKWVGGEPEQAISRIVTLTGVLMWSPWFAAIEPALAWVLKKFNNADGKKAWAAAAKRAEEDEGRRKLANAFQAELEPVLRELFETLQGTTTDVMECAAADNLASMGLLLHRMEERLLKKLALSEDVQRMLLEPRATPGDAIFSFIVKPISPSAPGAPRSWRRIEDGAFSPGFWLEREFASDPTIDITAFNRTAGHVGVHRVGVRLLERRPGTGGTGGAAQRVQLDPEARFSVSCPDAWRNADRDGIDAATATAWSELDAPWVLEKDKGYLRFTLRLDNFLDEWSASYSLVEFLLDTDHRGAEAKSKPIWLAQ